MNKKFQTQRERQARLAFDAFMGAAKRAQLPALGVLASAQSENRIGRVLAAAEQDILDSAATALETCLQLIAPEGRAAFASQVVDVALEWSIERDLATGGTPDEATERIRRARAADAATMANVDPGENAPT